MAGAGQLTNLFDSYDVVGDREELSDLISDISPTVTPLYSNIGSESTGNTFFEWQQDSLASAAQNHQIEGFDITTYSAVTATTRVGNYTSVSEKDFIISDTEDVINKAGRGREVAYQAVKKIKELKRDLETNYTANNAAVAGNASTARETGGLAAWLKTNTDKSATNGTDPDYATQPTSARSDGVERTWTETILKSIALKSYNSGGEPSMLMVGPYIKQVTSGFTGIAAQRFQAPAGPTTIIGTADVYLSDFGEFSIVPNRLQPAHYAYLLDPMGIRRRVLRPVRMREMAKTGDSTKYMIVCEEGLQVDNEAAHAIAADLTSA